MSHRFVVVALASAALLALGNASTAEAQLLGSTPLAVPVTGSVTGGGNFVGTLSIQTFSVQGSTTVAVAAIAGAVVNAPAGIGALSGMRASIVLPVTVNTALPITAYRPRRGASDAPRIAFVQSCSDVHVQIGGSVVDVMGVQMMLNPVVLDVGANSGGLIGSLVCQVAASLGSPTLLVGVLNQLLGQLVGLGGGLGGGLL
jgi:hypothetical protein